MSLSHDAREAHGAAHACQRIVRARHERKALAVVRIASVFRGHCCRFSARLRARRRHAAAASVQQSVRRRHGRKAAAATVIQAAARGRNGRDGVAVRAPPRDSPRARGGYSQLKESGLLTRFRVISVQVRRHQIAASTCVQSLARGALGRRLVWRLRVAHAAQDMIARNWRGYATRAHRWRFARARHAQWVHTAVRLQSHARCELALPARMLRQLLTSG